MTDCIEVAYDWVDVWSYMSLSKGLHRRYYCLAYELMYRIL